MEWLKKLLGNKAHNQFYIKSAIFFGIILFLNFFISLYFRHTEFFLQYLSLTKDYYIPWLTGLTGTRILNAVIFIVVAFIVYNKKRILDLKTYKVNVPQTITFGILAATMLVMQYYFKYLVKFNGAFFDQNIILTVFGKYLINILFLTLLAIAVYGIPFIFDFLKRFKKEIPLFIGIFIIYYFLLVGIQQIWFVLSVMVSNVLKYLLTLSFPDAFTHVTYGQAPTLGANGFVVGISKDCSGVDSLLLFISLYALLLLLDWKRMHVKRMLYLLVPGLIGTVLYNILRIYLLMLVGILYNPEFAVDVFHTNIGWILFLAFFMVFWHYGSKWVYKTKSPAEHPKARGKGSRKTSVPRR